MHLVDVQADQEHNRRLEDAVHARIRAELVVAADQLPAQDRARLQGLGQLYLSPRGGERLLAVDILLTEASL